MHSSGSPISEGLVSQLKELKTRLNHALRVCQWRILAVESNAGHGAQQSPVSKPDVNAANGAKSSSPDTPISPKSVPSPVSNFPDGDVVGPGDPVPSSGPTDPQHGSVPMKNLAPVPPETAMPAQGSGSGVPTVAVEDGPASQSAFGAGLGSGGTRTPTPEERSFHQDFMSALYGLGFSTPTSDDPATAYLQKLLKSDPPSLETLIQVCRARIYK